MLQTISEWLGSARYAEQTKCLTNDWLIIALYVGSDMMIAGSLFVVSLSFWLRRNTGFRVSASQSRLLAMIMASLAICHVMDFVVIFLALYRLDVILRGVAGGFALGLAISFVIACRRK